MSQDIVFTSLRSSHPWPLLFLGKLAATGVVIAILGAAALLLGAAQDVAGFGVPLAAVADAALTQLGQTALVRPWSCQRFIRSNV